ncbi:4'-phosphopantetheinyl transferase superfamily protein [Micromonospora sp. WMMD1128]|uniref:4'-phosphopantetheinyl transferase family protein n=1 Tax=unclassified Micromonospora TaxID=2617518 RepID=UPI00248CF535|nr:MULTISPECIES: 4'-phosphopantetheinyl transferase superfamily protein [unclassified Micromonospora]WBB73948.1 4'-phosphopantetheinyl transferase superfamily protein [Micromonospora sp. WMMD1128]WFE32652.1 4'-phosphopantetheinyl transferase superfamily protein [Micromonospora sp. WMMD975]
MTDPGGVDVWTVHLDRDVDAAHWLSAAELRRAAAVGDPDGRRRFVVAHAALNAILADRLDLRPTALPLRRNPRGRPYLPGRSLHFSLAHAGDRALIAVAGREVGVDLDHPRPGLDPRRMAARFFTPAEAARVAAAGTAAYAAYLRLWTRKEACVKAAGARLALGLRLPVPGAAGGAVVRDPSNRLPGAYFLRDLPDHGLFRAAVALAGTDPARCHRREFRRDLRRKP